jgi:hypothetical protein
MAATVLRKDHGMTRFSQEVVVFCAALFYSGFAAISESSEWGQVNC